jgi:hypothetical protein
MLEVTNINIATLIITSFSKFLKLNEGTIKLWVIKTLMSYILQCNV